jgi:hypothetical protein
VRAAPGTKMELPHFSGESGWAEAQQFNVRSDRHQYSRVLLPATSSILLLGCGKIFWHTTDQKILVRNCSRHQRNMALQLQLLSSRPS